MDWNEFRKYYKNKYGSVTQERLSKDYKAYKAKSGKSPTKSLPKKSPHKLTGRQALPYERLLKSLPKSRVVKSKTLKSLSVRKSMGRGSPTRGWAAAAPQKGLERQQLRKACGSKAFLSPPTGYPIMSLRASPGKCKVACQGVESARNRACQYKKCDIAKKAKKVGVKKCDWPKKEKPCKSVCQ